MIHCRTNAEKITVLYILIFSGLEILFIDTNFGTKRNAFPEFILPKCSSLISVNI
jgi:hypothetical protein